MAHILDGAGTPKYILKNQAQNPVPLLVKQNYHMLLRVYDESLSAAEIYSGDFSSILDIINFTVTSSKELAKVAKETENYNNQIICVSSINIDEILKKNNLPKYQTILYDPKYNNDLEQPIFMKTLLKELGKINITCGIVNHDTDNRNIFDFLMICSGIKKDNSGKTEIDKEAHDKFFAYFAAKGLITSEDINKYSVDLGTSRIKIEELTKKYKNIFEPMDLSGSGPNVTGRAL